MEERLASVFVLLSRTDVPIRHKEAVPTAASDSILAEPGYMLIRGNKGFCLLYV